MSDRRQNDVVRSTHDARVISRVFGHGIYTVPIKTHDSAVAIRRYQLDQNVIPIKKHGLRSQVSDM